MQDQIEMLTQERQSGTGADPYSPLGAQDQQLRNALLDSVAKEKEDLEHEADKRGIATFERALSWVAYAAVVVVAVLVTWTIGGEILKYLGSH